MSYTKLGQLDGYDAGASIDDNINALITEWTADNDATFPAPYYIEDIILLTQTPGYNPNIGIAKKKTRFWGMSVPIWVGYDNTGQMITSKIILSCPPFHPPNHGGPEMELSRSMKPETIIDPVDIE